MAGFLDRAKDSAQRGIDASRQKAEEVQATRAGKDLARKLGMAYYNEKNRGGSPEATREALTALESHVRENGDAGLAD